MITSENVQNILRNVPLIQEIEKLAKQENSYDSLSNNTVFKQFIDGLKPFVNELAPPPNYNWAEDKPFLQLIEVVNTQIINQLTEGEQDMNPESAVATKVIATKTAIVMGLGVIGVIGLIGIGLYACRCQRNKGIKKGGSVLERAGEVVGEIKAGFDSSTSKQPAPEPTPPPPTYNLLLVIDAKQLDPNLKQDSQDSQDSPISKDTAEKVIANATFAYCFAEGDSDGQKVLDAVECSDEDINYESEERVFLQLSVSAIPEITAKRDRYNIIDAMLPSDQQVEIKKLQKLQTMRSIKAFHRI